jgi:hypothetical protein
MVEEDDHNISKEYKLFIYRLKDKHYFLFQKFDFEEYIYIEKLSGNRFFSISNSRVELYSLSKDNKYSVVKDFSISNVIQFYEINENQFIFLTNNTKEKNYYIRVGYNNYKKIEYKEKFSFKIFYCNKLLYEYDIKSDENFSDFIVLKHKFGIFMIDNNLLIIDILKNNLIKK